MITWPWWNKIRRVHSVDSSLGTVLVLFWWSLQAQHKTKKSSVNATGPYNRYLRNNQALGLQQVRHKNSKTKTSTNKFSEAGGRTRSSRRSALKTEDCFAQNVAHSAGANMGKKNKPKSQEESLKVNISDALHQLWTHNLSSYAYFFFKYLGYPDLMIVNKLYVNISFTAGSFNIIHIWGRLVKVWKSKLIRLFNWTSYTAYCR